MSITERKTPTQRVSTWAAQVLGEESDTAPRCERYPSCGGEDGRGILETAAVKAELSRKPKWGANVPAYVDRVKELTAGAPRCKKCAAYARAVERLIERLEK